MSTTDPTSKGPETVRPLSPGLGSAPRSFRIRRLNHAVLYVSDLTRAEAFYHDVLGFETIPFDAPMRVAFLRASGSTNHHDLGLFEVGPNPEPPQSARVGLYHLAWQVDTIDELVDARARIVDADAFVGQSSHGATKSIYGADPDGNEFEIMWMLPRRDWGIYATSAPVDPLDLDAELSRWSGVRTADELGAIPI